ncbi:exodeoxyribonuclease III [Hyphomicrobium methylovorum]|uniref:exodeoxyribonuclease III n=1 Tax=Hyphomicrobium methylovorum TaxID=84 RepID=UPI0015E721E3|nr:exodeoxyribonuclease III [Hyphomicrobium methylovorum]MBA2127525.1 exodeoxyribonuclease III [Hyphomicrobium methylovorum]
MLIATWNINGVKARLESVLTYLRQHQPDVICMQEIKSVDEGFPTAAFQDLGYNVATHGQKGFNGVAILSKSPLEDVVRGLPGDDTDVHARWIEASVQMGERMVRVVSLYLPNGNPIDTEKFPYKLAWMKRLYARAEQLLAEEMPLVLAGDYNVIPEPEDAKRPQAWVNDALFQPESRAAWRKLVNLGLTDATRACHPGAGIYTFWDYQAGAFQRDDGIRIDHMLLSSQAADLLKASGIDRATRAQEKPSDHVPVWIKLAA